MNSGWIDKEGCTASRGHAQPTLPSPLSHMLLAWVPWFQGPIFLFRLHVLSMEEAKAVIYHSYTLTVEEEREIVKAEGEGVR